MKRLILLIAALCLFSAGCAGEENQTRDLPSAGSAVTQIMEDAAREESSTQKPEIPVEEPKRTVEAPVLSETEGVDIDLTIMSSTMVYAEVSGLMFEPEEHVGEVIRVRGENTPLYYEKTGKTYYYVLVADATACCAQGIEYTLSGDAEYPTEGEEITVTGEFELYEEEGIIYCRLKDAVME